MALLTQAPTAQPETFDTRLAAILRDLMSIAERTNKDGEHEVATDAQNCVNAVAALRYKHNGYFGDLDWQWEPEAQL